MLQRAIKQFYNKLQQVVIVKCKEFIAKYIVALVAYKKYVHLTSVKAR